MRYNVQIKHFATQTHAQTIDMMRNVKPEVAWHVARVAETWNAQDAVKMGIAQRAEVVVYPRVERDGRWLGAGDN